MNRVEITLAEPTESQLYSDAVVAGGLVYTTGQMPLTPDWDLVSEEFDAQVEHVFAQLARVLEASGAAVDSIVRLTIYLADIEDTARLHPLRRAFLGANRPASVIVQTGGFGTPGMLLEAEAVALVKE